MESGKKRGEREFPLTGRWDVVGEVGEAGRKKREGKWEGERRDGPAGWLAMRPAAAGAGAESEQTRVVGGLLGGGMGVQTWEKQHHLAPGTCTGLTASKVALLALS